MVYLFDDMHRENNRIVLSDSALNDLLICACDAQNYCLQAPSSENHYVFCGSEFGLDNEEKDAVIVRALHGRKSAGVYY